jgi:uncharacterized protein
LPSSPGSASTAFSLLAKPSGASCNLACGYCFYLSREKLYPGSNLRMSDQVLQSYIRQVLASQPKAEGRLDWQGGEPTLMGLDFFKRSVELAEGYKRPGQHISYSLQTNGTRLDEAWCAFFKQHDFLIGLSVDGPPALHNVYRVDKGGQGSYEQVKRAWDLLQKYQVDTNILCAVHAANAAHPLEVYRFFRDELGARFIQFIPIVEPLRSTARLPAEMDQPVSSAARRSHSARRGSLVSVRSVGSRQYGLFLIEVFDEWLRLDVGTVFVQMFDSALTSWCGLPARVCTFRETCGLSLVLEHNGDLYSCDHFVDPAHRLGNILERPLPELVRSPPQRAFGLAKRDCLPAYCRECEVRFACHGECPRNRFTRTPDNREGGLNYLCEGYRLFFQHVDQPIRRMAGLLRQGRAPMSGCPESTPKSLGPAQDRQAPAEITRTPNAP